jgi:sugar phosphate isomerase/epimerase
MRRRELLRMGALGAAAAWTATRVKRGLAADKLPIGVQLYSVREDCERDLPGTLKALKGFGYEAAEFAGYYGKSAAELRRLLDDNGLKCCGTHTGLNTLEGDALAKTVEFNKTLGNPFLIVPSIPEERRKTADDWKALAARFDALADQVAPAGMRVGYHNHNFEFAPIGGTTPWELAKPDAFVGEGDVPWKAVFDACETVGGTSWYIVEYEHESQPAIPAVGRCLANLRKMGK